MKYSDKLLGTFQRLRSEKEFPGSGIGLATVRRVLPAMVERAEGEINKGATF